MLRVHLFSFYTTKTSRALAALAHYRAETDKCTLTFLVHIHTHTILDQNSIGQVRDKTP